MASRILIVIVLALAMSSIAIAGVPFWGARTSSPTSALATLQPGEWIWGGDNAALGPIAVIVSLTEQRAYVYRNGILIGTTTVSTGKPGYDTPTGVFTILQKDKDHRSNIYDNAPMPYQLRLTWGGVALHAGGLPGYPESHGCVHLPTEFARLLFGASNMGMTVVVTKQGVSPTTLVHPRLLSPIHPGTGEALDIPRLASGALYRWQPELAPEGQISMIVSRADRRVIVLRNGIEIGRTRIALRDPDQPVGTHAYIMKAGTTSYNPLLPGKPLHNWMAIGLPGQDGDAGSIIGADTFSRVSVPIGFVEAVHAQLRPGAVMVLTDDPILPDTTGRIQQVMDADPPEGL